MDWRDLRLVVFVGVMAFSAQASAPESSHRLLLEQRLNSLEQKKTSLEEVPGSLDTQRTYQARIDMLRKTLGEDIPSFSEKTITPSSETLSASSESQDPPEVDYFHDRSQMVMVDQPIHDQAGVRPRSSLLDELPGVLLSRSVSEAPKRGIVIDGDDPKPGASMAVVAKAADLGRPGGMLAQQPESGTFSRESYPSVGVAPASLEHSLDPFSSKEPERIKKTEGTRPEGEGFQLPHGGKGMPPPVWQQASSARDYANKTGWSIDPIPIRTPIFYAPPMQSVGSPWGMPSTMLPSGGQGAYPAPMPYDPRFSSPPNKFMHGWH